MPTEALKQNHIKMYNTANTVTAGCSSLKSNGAWDKRKKNIGSSWKTHGKLVFCRIVTTNFLVNKDTDTAITKLQDCPTWSLLKSDEAVLGASRQTRSLLRIHLSNQSFWFWTTPHWSRVNILRRVLEQFSLTWPKVHGSNSWQRLSEWIKISSTWISLK